jgi:hypothetical protein
MQKDRTSTITSLEAEYLKGRLGSYWVSRPNNLTIMKCENLFFLVKPSNNIDIAQICAGYMYCGRS